MKTNNQYLNPKKLFSLLGGTKAGMLFFLLFPMCLVAQSTQDWQWIKRGGSTSTISTTSYRQEEVYDIHTDSEQNVYLLSSVGWWSINIDGNQKQYFGNPAFQNPNYALTSFSCDGTYRWSKIIGGGGSSQDPPQLQLDLDGNIYVAGKFGSCNGMDNYPPRIDEDIILPQSQSSCQTLFLVKFDMDGNLLWLKQPQEPSSASEAYKPLSRELYIDENGTLYWGLYLFPGTYANGAFINTQEGVNYFIFKYNTAGDFLEAISFDIEVEYSGLLNLKLYRNPYNENFYFNSRLDPIEESATVGGQAVNHSFFLASFDQAGNFLWKRENTSTEQYYGPKIYDLAFDSENNIYLGGKFNGLGLDEFLGFSIDETLLPSFIMKTDPTAENVLWVTHSMQSAVENGAFVLNNYTNELAFVNNAGNDFVWGDQSIQVNNNGEYKDVLLARFNPATGDCTHLDVISANPGYPDGATALAVDTAGDYLVGGGFSANLLDAYGNEVYNVGGQSDFFVAKFATQACNEPLAAAQDYKNPRISIYPNPVAERFQLEVEAGKQIKSMCIYSVNGKEVLRFKETQSSYEVSQLSAGIYFLKIKSETGESIKKIIKK